MAILEKNPEWVFKTQPLFIFAQKTTILKMHMVRIPWKKSCSKSACQALKLENKDFWLTTYSSPPSTLNTPLERHWQAVWIM
jgi:hypothetical protein